MHRFQSTVASCNSGLSTRHIHYIKRYQCYEIHYYQRWLYFSSGIWSGNRISLRKEKRIGGKLITKNLFLLCTSLSKTCKVIALPISPRNATSIFVFTRNSFLNTVSFEQCWAILSNDKQCKTEQCWVMLNNHKQCWALLSNAEWS